MDIKDISQEEFERIEAYLNNSLSKEDLLIFENRLQNEEGFAAKVEDIKTVLTGIETQALKEQLNEFHEDITTQEKETIQFNPKVKSLQWRKIAVAAALIIATGSFWFLNRNSNDQLYTDFYSPDPGLPTTMSSTDNYEFYEAMVSYKQGHYKEALNTWTKQLKTKVENDTLNYFIGSALLADKKESDAISYLKEVANNDDSVFKNDAFYYLGLAYLKNNNKEKAIEYLSKSDFTKAKDLLKKLN
ncbi:tetratricopeptide repeat protein [Winogradskyella algicola]|uniref:tetratricopeptide repeat protein n=1 Tax=Winogradskyella algicola TaxID=2575815 RepID=UPI001107BD52|nr:tetratricopeptide repeat protein [Winogradskyella algicola]